MALTNQFMQLDILIPLYSPVFHLFTVCHINILKALWYKIVVLDLFNWLYSLNELVSSNPKFRQPVALFAFWWHPIGAELKLQILVMDLSDSGIRVETSLKQYRNNGFVIASMCSLVAHTVYINERKTVL